MSVETDKAYRLKDTFSSGTNATGEAGVTSVFESLPGRTREKRHKEDKNESRGEKLTAKKIKDSSETTKSVTLNAKSWTINE